MTGAEQASIDYAIAITEHLNSIDPQGLAEFIIGQMEEKQSMSADERFVAGTAVLHAYNAIVAGAALAAVVGPADLSSA